MWEGANGIANRVILVDLGGNPVASAGAGGGSGAAGLTDAELRAAPLSVLGPLTDTQLRATAVPVSGPLTDAELRASPVAVEDADAASNRWALMSLLDTDEPTPGTTYLMYRPSRAGVGLSWGVKRVVTTGGNTAMRYAGPSNNPAVTDPWASRSTLVYGLPQEA